MFLRPNRVVTFRVASVSPVFREIASRKPFNPEPPKKPTRSYFLFMRDKRVEIMEKFPKLSTTDVAAKLGELWNSLSAQEKQKYDDEYAKKVEEFKTLHEKWWNSLSKEQQSDYEFVIKLNKLAVAKRKLKVKLRELGKPMKPKSGMLRFFKEYSENKKFKLTDDDDIDNMTRWKRLTEEEKSKYNAATKDDFRKYINDNKTWELKMMREGRGYLLRKWTVLLKEERNLKKKMNPSDDGSYSSSSSDSSDDET